jgi:aryl carrier-like protein
VDMVSEVLGVPGDEIVATRNLQDYGLDSIGGRRLMRALEHRFAIALTGREMLAHTTIDALAALVARRVAALAAAPATKNGTDYLGEFRNGALEIDEMKRLIAQGLIR